MQRFPLISHAVLRISASFASILLLIGIMTFSSCKTSRQSMYFMSLPRDTSIAAFVTPDYEQLIRKNDVLSVKVSSLNKELDEKFNSASSASVGTGVVERLGFHVNTEGFIELHYIGKLKAEGKSPKAVAADIQTALAPYMKEPIVQVQFLNHRITVMGEVNSPQVLYMNSGYITLMDALASTGDMKKDADRSRVMVIRDSNQVKQIKHLNLERHDVITSPWYYLQPNDIVYVMPRTDIIEKDEKRRNVQTTVSLVASLLSLVVIILTRFIN